MDPPSKKSIRPTLDRDQNVCPEDEGGQDYDDMLGFPADKDDTDPDETMETDLHVGDTPMDDTGVACDQSSTKKHKKSDVFPSIT